MRKTGNFLLLGGFLAGLSLTASTAGATVLVMGDGASVTARGSVEGLAADPFGSGDIDVADGYDESRLGTLSGFSSDVASGQVSALDPDGAPVLLAKSNAAFSTDFSYDGGGNLESGSILFSTLSSVFVGDGVFDDTAGGEFAMSQAAAESILFLDLEISGVGYQLEASGSVKDDSLGLSSSLTSFVVLFDITGDGFQFLEIASDAVGRDRSDTPFAWSQLLEPGHLYRLGAGANADFLCAENPLSNLCPPLDPLDPASTDAQVAGLYDQEGRVSFEFSLRAVPEPGSALLTSVGLAGLALAGRRGRAAGSSRARHRYQHATVR